MSNAVDTMRPKQEGELEREEVVARVHESPSSELSSYERIPLGELTDAQILTIAKNGDLETVHRRSAEVGMTAMKFIHYFQQFKPLVVSMKERLCAVRGSHRKTMVGGVMHTWSSYCVMYYGCSCRWVQKLIEGEYNHVPGDDADGEETMAIKGDERLEPVVEHTQEPKLGKKDKQILELQKYSDTLKEEIKSRGNQIADLLLKGAEAKHEAQMAGAPDLEDDGFGFVMDYFEPIAQPLHFASELDRLIRECNMQEHVKTVMIKMEGL